MKVTRVHGTDDGGSAFEEIEIELSDAGSVGWLSGWVTADAVAFRENAPDYDWDWHCAPARQLIVLLDGAIEIEVTSGEKRAFGGGDVLLVEDTSGRGHRTMTTDGRSRRSLFIRLPDDAVLPRRGTTAG